MLLSPQHHLRQRPRNKAINISIQSLTFQLLVLISSQSITIQPDLIYNFRIFLKQIMSCYYYNCAAGCCNYYGNCPNYYSPSVYSNSCWYYYERSSSNSSAVIGGAIAAAIIGLIIIILIIWWCRRRRQEAILERVQMQSINRPHHEATTFIISGPTSPQAAYGQSYGQPYGQPYVQPYSQPYQPYGQQNYDKYMQTPHNQPAYYQQPQQPIIITQ